MSQIIVSVGREFGSGGHAIAELVSEKLGIPLYDNDLIADVAEKMRMNHDEIAKYNEQPRKRLISRTVRGYSNSIEENIAQMQFDFLRKKAAEGESFVVVGRCAETILKDNPSLVSLFILADKQAKTDRIMNIHGISAEKAALLMEKKDKDRKAYHDAYCPLHWGDPRLYDLCVNSTRLGIEKTADFIEQYINFRRQ